MLHLVRGLEELLLASAQGLSRLRTQLEDEAETAATPLWALIEPSPELILQIREALRAERVRWEQRATHDPAARRVAELCTALIDVLNTERSSEGERSRTRSRAPRRGAAGGFAGGGGGSPGGV